MRKHLLISLLAVMVTIMGVNAQTIVIDDGFENGILDSVWTQEFVVGNHPWAVESVSESLMYPANVFQGNSRAYLRNTSGETEGYVTRLVSKVMDLSPEKVYQPELTFWYANPKWTADRDTLRLLYRTGQNAKWKKLAEFSSASSNWQKVALALPEVNESYQIAFEGTDNLGRGIVLDSIKLRSAPECTVPYNVTANNLGNGKVNISWNASWDANAYQLVITKDTIGPDTLANVADSVIVYAEEIDGIRQNQDVQLVSGEYYYVYLRSLCSTENSVWNSDVNQEGVYHFRVKATKYLPYSYDFNKSYTAGVLYRDPEWTWGNNTGHYNPHISTQLNNTELKKYSNDGTQCLVFSGDDNATTAIPEGLYAYVASPGLADSTVADFKLNTCQVSFWATVASYTGKYAHSIIVGVMTDPEDVTTFVPVDTVSVWGQKTFQENIVDLGSYEGEGTYVAFASYFDKQNLFYIDNVKIEQKPAVNKVTKISVNPRDTYATIAWEGNAASYRVLVAKEELDLKMPKQEDIIVDTTLSANSFVCEGLKENTSWEKPYYVYVKAQDKEWSYRYPFITVAGIQELPMTFDMEEQSGFYLMNAVKYPNNIAVFSNDPDYPHLYTTNPYKGKSCLYLSKVAGNDSWITFPMLDSIQDKQITFYLSGNTTPGQVHATVGVMTNPMDINTFVPVADFVNAEAYARCYTSFVDYKGPKGLIAIVWSDTEDAKNTVNYIDNVTIEPLASCVPPKNLNIEAAAASAQISWIADGKTAWEVAVVKRIKLNAFQQELTLAEIANLEEVVYTDTIIAPESGNPGFEVDSLDFVTPYYIYVRAICGEEQSWFTEAYFKTVCPEMYTAPYVETFDYMSESDFACWQVFDAGTGTGYPKINAGSGGAQQFGKSMELWSTSTTHRNWAAAPKVDMPFDEMMLQFHARSWSSSAKSILYIGFMTDPSDTLTFTPIDTIYIPNGTKYHHFSYEMSQYKAYEGQYIVFTSGMYSVLEANSDVNIDNVSFKSKKCAAPYGLETTDVQTTSVDIKWQGMTEDKWEVKVLNKYAKLNTKFNVIAPYNPATAIINDTILDNAALHIEGLTPKTKYYVYMRPTCGDSIWAVDSVKTGCLRINPNVVNKETFENAQSGTSYNADYQVDCWTAANAYASATSTYLPYVYKSTTYASSGENSYRMYGYASGTSQYNPVWCATPEIECDDMSELLVTFNYYMSTTSGYALLYGVMTDPDDINTFVVLDSIQGTGSSVQVTVEMSDFKDSIPEDARYFAWRTPIGATTTVYLDDVSILRMKCPIPKPTFSGLESNKVRVNSGLRGDNDWLLLITNKELVSDSLNKEGFTYPDSIVVKLDTIDVRSKLITGLKENTDYYVAVASYCGDTIVPYWVTSKFKTPCTAVTPEALGTITFDTKDGYTTGQGGYLPCWTVGNKNPSASSGYIPWVYTTASHMHNGLNSIEIWSSTTNNGSYAIMPQLAVDSIKNYQVNFWGQAYSTSTLGKLIVGVVTDPGDLNTFVPVGDTISFDGTNWNNYTVLLESYEGDYLGNQGKYIMFISEFDKANDVFISEISVEKIPSCKPVTTITVDSIGDTFAYISFESEAPKARLLVANKDVVDSLKASYDNWIVDTVVTKYDSIRIEGLEPNSNFYAYAQNICSESDSSKISMANLRFVTDCPSEGGFKAPYFVDFDNNSVTGTGKRPDCWDGVQLTWDTVGSTQSYPYVYTSNAYSGKNDLYMYSYLSSTTSATATNYKSIAVAPVVNGSLNDYMVSFYARQSSSTATSYGKRLYIGYVTNTEKKQIDSTFVSLGYVEVSGTVYQYYEFTLLDKPAIPAGARIALKSDWELQEGLTATSRYAHFYVDNFRIGLPPSCYPPTLEAGNTTLTTAEVKITPSEKGGSLWELAVIPDSAYKKIDDIEAYLDTVTNTLMADTTAFIIQGLQSGTMYQVYARTVCGGEDGNSAWTESPILIITQYYYKDAYTFGFEKSEEWIRSPYSTSDNNYQHPALIFGYDTVGSATTSSSYMPYQIENTSSYVYGYGPKDGSLGKAGLRLYAYKSGSTSYYGQYVVFPGIVEAKARSFEFQARNLYLSNITMKTSTTYPGHFLVGTIEKGKGIETFDLIADIKLPMLTTAEKAVVANEANNYLFKNYTFDFDSLTMANRQVVFYQPEVDLKDGSSSAMTYFDNVKLGDVKGYSSLGFKSIAMADTTAEITWSSIGGPWNLYITGTHYDELLEENVIDTVAAYENLTVPSQVVNDLEENTNYVAILVPANKPDGVKYELEARKSFKTKCKALEPDAEGKFFWNFDDPADWERSDVLPGSAADTAYYKPGCFTVGTTYSTPTSAAQYDWLIQRKGMPYTTAPTYSSTYATYEYGRKDSKALRVYTTSTYVTATAKEYLVLPLLNCDLDTMMIEFWGRCFANYDNNYSTVASRKKMVSATYLGASYSKSVVVGTLTDPDDFSTLEVIDTLTYSAYTSTTATLVTNDPAGNDYWQKMQLPLGGAKGKYIVLYQPAYGLFFLDDLSIKPVGDNIFAPTKPVTNSVGVDTASVSWQVKHPTMQSVVVLLDEKENEVLRDTIVGTDYTFTNLTPATIYFWYMYQTTGTANSSETGRVQFTTGCLSTTPAYATGFEPEEGWWLVPGQSTDTYKQNKCWIYGNAGTSAWSSTYCGYNQMNSTTIGYSHSGNYALRMEAYGTTYQPYAAMPALDVAAFDTLQVNFWMRPAYHGLGTSTNADKISTQYTLGSTAATAEYYYSKSIIVGTMTDPEDPATFVAIDTIGYTGTLAVGDAATKDNDYLFQKKKVSLRGATGPYVAFMTTLYAKGAENKSTYGYMWLDDISFSKLQECMEPVNMNTAEVTAYEAELSWEGSELTEKYVLQVSTDPAFYYDTAFVFNDTVEATSYKLENLQPYTQYAWRVQAICGEEFGESEFTSNVLFKTARMPFFLEDFRETSLSSEWSFGTNPAALVLDSAEVDIKGSNSTSYGFKRITNSYGISGAHYCVPFFSSSTVSTTTYDHYWMISPALFLPDSIKAHLTLDLALTQCTSGYTPTANEITVNDIDEYDFFAIIISDDGGKTWKKENAAVWNDSVPGANKLSDVPATAQNWRFDLAKYAGKNIRVAFYRESQTYKSKGSAMHIGNVRVAYFDDMSIDTVICQYTDVDMEEYGLYIDGDNAEIGTKKLSNVKRALEDKANAGAKDTIYTMTATIVGAPEVVLFDTICDGDTYSDENFHGKSRAGIYRRKLQSVEHCDSIITLNLFVAPLMETNETDTVCFGETYIWHGMSLNRSGRYADTLLSMYGCDSIVYMNLTIRDQIFGQEEKTICHGSAYAWNGKIYSNPGTYKDTLKSVLGCDSIVTLTLYVSDIVVGDPQKESVCYGGSFVWNGVSYNKTGLYYDTIQAIGGCDSVAILDLTVMDIKMGAVFRETVCHGGTYSWYGKKYNEAGTYYDTITSAQGCDSVLTLILSVAPMVKGTPVEETICHGGSYVWNGKTYSNPGMYYDTLVSDAGCDSIATLIIKVSSEIVGKPMQQAICNGGAYTWNGNTYSVAGTYYDTIQSVSGCDSIAILELSVMSVLPGEPEKALICQGETYAWNSAAYTQPGTYKDTIPSAFGCDSVITLVLNWYGKEDTIYARSSILTTDLPFTYENADYPYIVGQAPIYYAVGTVEGVYVDTVLVQGVNCNAIMIHTLTVKEAQGIDNTNAGGVTIQPNVIRAGENVTAVGNFNGTVQIYVYDMVGHLVKQERTPAASSITIGGFYQAGLYNVRISDTKGTLYVGRVLVK